MTLKDLMERLDYGRKIEELIDKGMIPISPKMMDDLGYLEGESIAYHFTNSHDLKNLKGISKKAQLSCFTKPGLALTKLPSNPNVLAKVEGRMLLKGNHDLYTHLDFDGRRWLQVDLEGSEAGNKLKFMIDGILKKLKKEYTEYSTLFYKEYLKRLSQYLDKGGYKLLNAHMKEAEGIAKQRRTDYNEVIMDRINVIGVWSFKNDAQKEIIQKLGFKYLGVITSEELLKL